jgi:hypothetical protein
VRSFDGIFCSSDVPALPNPTTPAASVTESECTKLLIERWGKRPAGQRDGCLYTI